ncbi:Homeobox-leucine zipper protein HOX32, partial [Cucurbita argyrosperma subsp. argyrosperma]
MCERLWHQFRGLPWLSPPRNLAPKSVQKASLARQRLSRCPNGSPEAIGAELFQVESQSHDAILKQLWHHSDTILCCSVKTNASPVFTFANQAGLDMLETTLVALQDITLDKILEDAGRKILCSEFSKIMQQGFAYLPAGICISSMGRPVSYEQAIAWKVLNDDDVHHCLAFMFVNWSFM